MADIPRRGELGVTGTLGGEESLADEPQPAAAPTNLLGDFRMLDPRIGKVYGKYVVTRCIGSGGMATVYEGEDQSLKRKVALKFLGERLLAQPAAVERFMREAQVAGRLAHPNVIGIYDVCHDRRSCYMVMELVDPKSAGQHLREVGPYYWIVATRIIVDCCSALKVAHEAGVIHRDIKPDNILFSSTGVVKLADFGIVKTLAEDNSLTMTGQLVGTPVYMSPEQGLDARNVDVRSDVYALGATYFALLTGRPPFSGSSLLEILANVRTEPPPDPRDLIADIPEACALVIKRTLEKSPDARHKSAAELLTELQSILDRIPRWQQSIYELEKELPRPRPRAAPPSFAPNSAPTPLAPPPPPPLPTPATGADSGTGEAIPVGVDSVSEIIEPLPPPPPPPIVAPKAPEEAASPPQIARPVAAPASPPPRGLSRRLWLAAGAASVSAAGLWMLSGARTSQPTPTPLPTPPPTPTPPHPEPTPPTIAVASPAPPPVVLEPAPIRVGVLHSLTGALAVSERPLADATLLALEELNAKGGLLGRKLDPILLDGKSEVTNESAFARAARRMVVEDRVAVVFGGFGSAGRKAIKPYFEENDCLLFYPADYEGLEESANIIYTGATPNQFVLPAIKWFARDGKRKRVFLVGTDGVRPRAISILLGEELGRHKWTLLETEFATVGTYEFAATIKKIAKRKPDLILSVLVGDSLVAFLKQLHQARRRRDDLPVLCFTLGESEMVQLSAEALTGHYVARAQFPLAKKGADTGFVSRFLKKYGQHRVVSETMESAYYGVHLWAAVVREAGSTSTHVVRNALREKEYGFEGVRFHIDPSNQHSWKTFQLGRIDKQNRIQILHEGAEPLPPLPFPPGRTRAEWKALLDELRDRWQQNWANPAKPGHVMNK